MGVIKSDTLDWFWNRANEFKFTSLKTVLENPGDELLRPLLFKVNKIPFLPFLDCFMSQ